MAHPLGAAAGTALALLSLSWRTHSTRGLPSCCIEAWQVLSYCCSLHHSCPLLLTSIGAHSP
jgi:hypothetical protein